MAIHIILDVFPKSYGKFKAKWRKKKEKKARRRQKMDRTVMPQCQLWHVHIPLFGVRIN